MIALVATLHHMELQPTLEQAAALLRPGGHLMVVGLAANHTPSDWILSAAALWAAALISDSGVDSFSYAANADCW